MTQSHSHITDRAVAESKDCWMRIQQDDKTGLEGLYALFAFEMMAFGLSIVPDRTLIKDCIQELFIEIWRYRKNGAVVKNVKVYVFKALSNKIKKELAREKKRNANDQELGANALYFQNEAESGIIHLHQEEANNRRLSEALSKLPPRQMEVIRYVFFENLPNEQVAKLMGINIQSVYTLSWKAICKLRNLYILFISFYFSL
ncbi:RNA polymerase sigma factor [Cyclobacterium jeungdonense]|uniref:Sigma-70 family RNA polymerase sigma factor n=1 Tax=Cyclobacterium jeungdonense TaxID=708087 RepID=A0ABT8C399_9BACT|nr:sigma-70 family RNA polymerase sigma factor [Cyclobacterium jeungdonense]MDN3686235.1 sigma-70 family RNA polymerase sigma factor [Cyclobacterium jeungdonense]